MSFEDEFSGDGAFEVVRSPIGWGGASVLCFFAAIWHAMEYDWSKSWAVLVAISCAILTTGLVFARIGMREERNRFSCLAGALLNGGGWLAILVPAVAYALVVYGIVG